MPSFLCNGITFESFHWLGNFSCMIDNVIMWCSGSYMTSEAFFTQKVSKPSAEEHLLVTFEIFWEDIEHSQMDMSLFTHVLMFTQVMKKQPKFWTNNMNKFIYNNTDIHNLRSKKKFIFAHQSKMFWWTFNECIQILHF